MRTRCNNPNYDKYQWYGGKGVTVCDEWSSFKPFREWALSHGYQDSLTIDRIDPNSNYNPENCRWVDRKAQANNRTSNRMITYNGKTQSMQLWAEELGINASTFKQRLNAMPLETAMTMPVHTEFRDKLYTYNGETKKLADWARSVGQLPNSFRERMRRGMTFEEALLKPVKRGVALEPC